MKWTVQPASRFHVERARWDALHAQAGSHALLAADFVAPLLDCFGSGRERLAWCEHGGRTVAMALLSRTGAGAWSTFQPPQAPLGLWLQAPQTDGTALARSLLPALPGMPLVLGLTQLDPLLQAPPAAAPGIRTLPYIDTAALDLAGGFDAYWAQRGKNLRANLRKQRSRLARDGVATRLTVCTDPARMAQAVADYGRLESAGWKAGAATAVAADNAQGRYYRAMLTAFARRGAARVYRYYFGPQLVAMDLCVSDGERLVVLKTAYDETVEASLSPAMLMREEACRALFAQPALRRLEFYGRVMDWHLRWTDQVRTLYHVNCYRWPALGRLHAFAARRRAARPTL